MRFFVNIILYLAIAFLLLQNQIVAAVVLVFIFTYRVGAVWLIPLAFCLDGYFGAFYDVPYITLVSLIWYGVSEFIRPRLIMQFKDQDYEKTA
jgi:hypothetical protein